MLLWERRGDPTDFVYKLMSRQLPAIFTGEYGVGSAALKLIMSLELMRSSKQ